MAHLIDKDALVAEIERLKTIYKDDENIRHVAKYNNLVDILSFINTLEVKEVDLSKEIDNYFDNYKFAKKEECWLNHDQAYIFAKHFFELGLKAQKAL